MVLPLCLILAVAHWVNWGSPEGEQYFIFPENECGGCRERKGRTIGAASICLQSQWNLGESWKDQGMSESRSISQFQTWQEENDFTKDQKRLMRDLLQLRTPLKNSGQRTCWEESTSPIQTQWAERDLFNPSYLTDLSFLWLEGYLVQG